MGRGTWASHGFWIFQVAIFSKAQAESGRQKAKSRSLTPICKNRNWVRDDGARKAESRIRRKGGSGVPPALCCDLRAHAQSLVSAVRMAALADTRQSGDVKSPLQ